MPITEADDLSKPAIAGTIPVEIPGTTTTEESIARRAYELYEAEGRRDGRALEHWLAAEYEVKRPARAED